MRRSAGTIWCAAFEETLRVYPNYAEAHSNLGQLLVEQGDVEGGSRVSSSH